MIQHYGDPLFLAFARADVGLAEIPGQATASKIGRWLRELGAWWSDDETPWCGVAMAAWMQQAGIAPPKHYYRAREWLNWGKPIAEPVVGCVGIMGRVGGGHVTLITGKTPDGMLVGIGGNQGNRVCEASFDPQRFLGFRIPPGDRQYRALPVIHADGSESEA